MADMNIEKRIETVKHDIEELTDETMQLETLDDHQATALVELEQMVHDKLSVVFDKFDIEVGDERSD